MTEPRAKLRLISGVGAKGPACFLLESDGSRLLLDLGEGPPPGRLPRLEGLGRIDAIILSHGHRDHVGGLSLTATLGNPPVYATEPVRRGLPKDITVLPLPIGGTTEVCGLPIKTGRNGHAPGGVWLYFSVGDGLLYTGDFCTESALYAYDASTLPAATLLTDCSYATYETPLRECWTTLAPFLDRAPLLLPVPANGRGPEIALELMRHGRDDLYVDDAMDQALRRLADHDGHSVRPDAHADIRRLVDRVRPIDGARGIMLAGSPDGTSGATKTLLPQCGAMPEVAILFTGYVNPTTPAEQLTRNGRAQTMRWNVHPRLSDTVVLARAVSAKTVIPAFCDRSEFSALGAALAPACVTMAEQIEL